MWNEVENSTPFSCAESKRLNYGHLEASSKIPLSSLNQGTMIFVLRIQHVSNQHIAVTSLLWTSFYIIEAELLWGKLFGSRTLTHLRNCVIVLEVPVMVLPSQPLSLRMRDVAVSGQIPWASVMRKNIIPSHLYFLLQNFLSLKVWFKKWMYNPVWESYRVPFKGATRY